MGLIFAVAILGVSVMSAHAQAPWYGNGGYYGGQNARYSRVNPNDMRKAYEKGYKQGEKDGKNDATTAMSVTGITAATAATSSSERIRTGMTGDIGTVTTATLDTTAIAGQAIHVTVTAASLAYRYLIKKERSLRLS